MIYQNYSFNKPLFMDFNIINNLREVHIRCYGLEDFNAEPSILIISNFTCMLLKKDSPLKENFVLKG